MISIKEALRTIKYRKQSRIPKIGFIPMTRDELLHNKMIIERRMKERRHNSRQRMRDKVTLYKIQRQLIIQPI